MTHPSTTNIQCKHCSMGQMVVLEVCVSAYNPDNRKVPCNQQLWKTNRFNASILLYIPRIGVLELYSILVLLYNLNDMRNQRSCDSLLPPPGLPCSVNRRRSGPRGFYVTDRGLPLFVKVTLRWKQAQQLRHSDSGSSGHLRNIRHEQSLQRELVVLELQPTLCYIISTQPVVQFGRLNFLRLQSESQIARCWVKEGKQRTVKRCITAFALLLVEET